jgi:large subunit ribosomal protein L9
MRQNLLLLEDVIDLGRSGEIVSVKSGFARNFLLPQKKGVIATEHTLRMQARLKEERAKKAVTDKVEAEALAKVIELITLQSHQKVDPEGKMYGSVTQQDIIELLEKHDIKLDKRDVLLKHPIKETGSFTISFRLKEGVPASCKLEVIPEGVTTIEIEEKEEAAPPKKEKKRPVRKKKEAAIEEEKSEIVVDEENPSEE